MTSEIQQAVDYYVREKARKKGNVIFCSSHEGQVPEDDISLDLFISPKALVQQEGSTMWDV